MQRSITMKTFLPYPVEKVWSAFAGIHSDKVDKAAKGIFAKLDTLLAFQLEPTCGGTLLTMKHSGYRGLKLVIISFIMQMGWKKQLKRKLPKVLAA